LWSAADCYSFEILDRVSLQRTLMIIGVLVVVAVANYWTLIPTVVMLVLFFLLRMYYIPTSRSIKRLEGISKWQLFSYFMLYFAFIVLLGNVCLD